MVPFTLRWYKAHYRLDVLFLLGASGSCGGVVHGFYLFIFVNLSVFIQVGNCLYLD